MSKSARREFNYELPDLVPLRLPNIPGGKKHHKKMHGGKMADDFVPPQHAIEISGGAMINDGRGNIMDTDQAIKGGKKKGPGRPKKMGGNIWDTLGSVAKSAAPFLPLLALGKKKGPGRPKKMGGANGDSFIGVKSGEGKKHKKYGGFQSSPMPQFMTNPYEEPNPTSGGKKHKKQGAGIFGDIGDGLDAVGSLIGFSKKNHKQHKLHAHKQEMDETVKHMEAGLKHMKKLMKKMK